MELKLPKNPSKIVLSSSEYYLYKIINDYRKSRGLLKISLSKSLSFVAKTHVIDLHNHPPSGKCNLHSWSNKGYWKPFCYTDDHANAQFMWDKPRELTNYLGNGYEIATRISKKNSSYAALSGWKRSPPHNAVIINTGIWNKVIWKALGIGIYKSYCVAWFGEEPDSCSK